MSRAAIASAVLIAGLTAPGFDRAATGLGRAGGSVGEPRAEAALPLLARFDFETGRADGWRPKAPAIWSVVPEGGSRVYRLTAAGEPGGIRAPQAWSLIEGADVSSFDVRGRLKCDADPANPHRDLCVLFHFRDAWHFLYVHFSASSDEAHNIIGLVDGRDRVRISREPAGTSKARLLDRAFHPFRVACDARSGEIRAYLDDLSAPILTAVDRTFGHGLVGLGSFDDTGGFDDVELRGIAVGGRAVPGQGGRHEAP